MAYQKQNISFLEKDTIHRQCPVINKGVIRHMKRRDEKNSIDLQESQI